MRRQKYLSTVNMDRLEWLKERQKGIGGTDVSAILKYNPFKTPLDVYREKTSTLIDTTDENHSFFRVANTMEGAIAEDYSIRYGKKVQNDNKIRYHEKYDILYSNMDRLILKDQDFPNGVLECKTAGAGYFRTWDDEIPKIYMLQIIHYLMVTGYEWGAFHVYIHDKKDFWTRMVYREEVESTFPVLQEQLLEWWDRHIINNIPPDPVNDGDIKSLFPTSQEKTIIAVPETFDKVKKIKELKQKKKEFIDPIDKELKPLEIEVKSSMGDADTLVNEDIVIATFKSPKAKDKFNEAKFKADHPDLHNKYLESSQGSRRFLIK